jgi:CheY-like chemotaxis protein
MGAKVMIVEDNDDCREVLAVMLKDLGCIVTEATDGLDAIGKAVSTRPDLILMDLRMPKLGGLEATRRLKANPLTKDIPVVICTALGTAALGYATFLSSIEVVKKPVRLERLREVVRKYVPLENQQRTILRVEDSKSIDVLAAWRLLRKIKHEIDEGSLGLEYAEAHNCHPAEGADQRRDEGRPARDKKREALLRLLSTIKGEKLFAGFLQLLHGGMGCLICFRSARIAHFLVCGFDQRLG